MDPADLGQQLTELLGRSGPLVIRKTNHAPPQVSVIDVVAAITDQDANHAAMGFRRIKERHPELDAFCTDFKFPGRPVGERTFDFNSTSIGSLAGAVKTHTRATHGGEDSGFVVNSRSVDCKTLGSRGKNTRERPRGEKTAGL